MCCVLLRAQVNGICVTNVLQLSAPTFLQIMSSLHLINLYLFSLISSYNYVSNKILWFVASISPWCSLVRHGHLEHIPPCFRHVSLQYIFHLTRLKQEMFDSSHFSHIFFYMPSMHPRLVLKIILHPIYLFLFEVGNCCANKLCLAFLLNIDCHHHSHINSLNFITVRYVYWIACLPVRSNPAEGDGFFRAKKSKHSFLWRGS